VDVGEADEQSITGQDAGAERVVELSPEDEHMLVMIDGYLVGRDGQVFGGGLDGLIIVAPP